MARPLRFEVRDGWHHVTARGNERRAIFRDDEDRRAFLELLPACTERFGIVVTAYVLMANHYHLVLRTPLANLSSAIQWLNVSYSIFFNRRHRRSGHLFQGRFKSVLVDPSEWLGELTRYVHLNPVRTRRLGLAKTQRAEAEQGCQAPSPEVVGERLRALRAFRWSSYRAYAGYAAAPPWLKTQEVLGRYGGNAGEQRTRHRDHVESAVRQGLERRPWENVMESAVLGTAAFVGSIRGRLRAMRGERHRIKRALDGGGPGIESVRRAVERVKGERWEAFAGRHGDGGRDIFLWVARRHCRLTLERLGAVGGGMSAGAASEAVRRVQCRLKTDKKLVSQIKAVNKLLNVQM